MKRFSISLEKNEHIKLNVCANDSYKQLKNTLTRTDSAKELMTFVQEWSQTVDKSLAGTLLSILTIIKYDGQPTMYEHVLKMTTLAAKLRVLVMNMDEYFFYCSSWLIPCHVKNMGHFKWIATQ